jgi:hypothetical protein
MNHASRQTGLAKLLFTTAKSSIWTRLFPLFRDEYADPLKRLSWDVYGSDSIDYYLSKGIAYGSDDPTGRAYYDSLARWARPKAERRGDQDPSFRLFLVTGLAGAGKREAAAAEIKPLLDETRYVWNALHHEEAAKLCVLVGMPDCAFRHIQGAMVSRSTLNANLLKLEPGWAPLRGDPRFLELVATGAR